MSETDPAPTTKEVRRKMIGRPFEKNDPRINRGGRPKSRLLTDLHEELLTEKLSDPEAREQLKQAIWSKLLSKDVVSVMTMDKLWERVEGKISHEVIGDLEVTLSLGEGMRIAMDQAEERLRNRERGNG